MKNGIQNLIKTKVVPTYCVGHRLVVRPCRPCLPRGGHPSPPPLSAHPPSRGHPCCDSASRPPTAGSGSPPTSG